MKDVEAVGPSVGLRELSAQLKMMVRNDGKKHYIGLLQAKGIVIAIAKCRHDAPFAGFVRF